MLEALVRGAIEGIIDEDLMERATQEQAGHREMLSKIADRFEDVREFLEE